MPNTMLNPQKEYESWDAFKRDLERKLGLFLNVDTWLGVKPKKPLPWNSVDLQTSLSEVLRRQQEYGGSSMLAQNQVKMYKQ